MPVSREQARKGNNAKMIGGAVIGAVIGFFLGGPAGAVKGALYGAQVGMMFGTTVLPDGPRVNNLTQSGGSSYGMSRSILYGTDVLPNNIIWMKQNRIQEFSRQEKVGKRQYQTLYNYSISFALALGEGEMDEVTEVYANNVLIYKDTDPKYQASVVEDANKENGEVSSVRFYRGDYAQLPDPDMIADVGTDCPGFRGEAYIIFKNFDLTDKYFNSPPTFRTVARRKKFTQEFTAKPTELFVADVTYTDGINTTNKPLFGISDNTMDSEYGGYIAYVGAGGTQRLGQQLQIGYGHWYPSKYQRGLISASWMPIPTKDQDRNPAFNPVSWSTAITNGSEKNPLTDTRYKVDYAYDASFPTILTRYSFDLVRLRYTESSLHTEQRGGTNVGTLDITNRPAFDTFDQEVLRLYAFDVPFDGTRYTSVSEQGSGISGAISSDYRENILSVYPVHNSDELFFIMWVDSGSSITQCGLATIDYDRFVIHRLKNFNLDDYGLVDGYFLTANYTPANYADARGAKDFKCLYFAGNVYIYRNRQINAPSFLFAGVLVIPNVDGIDWAWPVQVKQEPSLFSWSTFTFYNGGDYYTLNQQYLDYDNPNKVINDWYVTDYWWTDLIPDYKNGQLYAMNRNNINATYTALTLGQSLPRVKPWNQEHIYKIDNTTLANSTDYGSIGVYCAANTIPNTFTLADLGAWVASNGIYGLHFISPFAIIRVDPTTGTYSTFYKNTWVTSGSFAYPMEAGYGNNILSPQVNGHTLNLIMLQDNSDITDVLIVYQVHCGINGGTIPSSNIYGETRRVRYYHTPYLSNLLASDDVKLDQVVSTEMLRTGLLTAADFDVTQLTGITVRGFTIAEQSTVADNLKALMSAYLFDIVEEDYKLKCRLRSAASIRRTIAFTDLQAGEQGQQVFEIRATVPPTYKTPTQYQVSYRDVNTQYESGMQQIDNPFGETQATSELQLPVVMSSDEAYTTLEQSMRATQFAQAGMIEFSTTMKHSDLEASDWITVGTEDGSSFTGRISDIDKGQPGIVKIILVPDVLSNYVGASVAQTGQSTEYEPPADRAFTPIMIDAIPFTADQVGPGFWFGAYADINARVQFAFQLTSAEGNPIGTGRGVVATGTYLAAVTAGRGKNALPATGGPGYIDYSQSITIQYLGGAFASVTEAVLYGDEMTNTYFYGAEGRWEIIKIASWTDNGNGTYTGTGILRGYKGTAHLMQNHIVGDFIYSVDGMTRVIGDPLQIDKPVIGLFNGATSITGQDETEYKIKRWLSRDQDRFLPPNNLFASRNTAGDWLMQWQRQSRFGIEWRNGSEASLDTAIELYKIYILNVADNDKVLRTITASQLTTATWTAAQQVTDFGTAQGAIRFAVQQVNSLTLATTDIAYRFGTPALGVF